MQASPRYAPDVESTPLPAGAFTLPIAALALLGVAFGRLPGLPWRRTTFALIGATALLAVGVLDLPTAPSLLDLEVLAVPFGLLLVNEALVQPGASAALAGRLGRAPLGPFALLAITAFSAALLSALLLDDTVVLMVTPLLVDLRRRRGLPPLPYLLALATAANAGSVATLTGNPQNVLIGVRGRIPSLEFAGALAPVALAGANAPRLLAGIDHALLLLFAGLFVVVGAVDTTGLGTLLIAAFGDSHLTDTPPLTPGALLPRPPLNAP